MPVLVVRDLIGHSETLPLHGKVLTESMVLPLTIGTNPSSAGHFHISHGEPVQVRIQNSSVERAYPYILSGQKMLLNKRSPNTMRVLRHGDLIALEGITIRYLDFMSQTLQEHEHFLKRIGKQPSKLKGHKCSLPSCTAEEKMLDNNDAFVICPWCHQVYHAWCWLGLDACMTPQCYPIRRMLLAEMAGQVKIEHVSASGDRDLVCLARCDNHELWKQGDEIIRCQHCKSAFHPGCWFSLRGMCPFPGCNENIAATVRRLVYHTEE